MLDTTPSTNLSKIKIEVGKTEMLSRYLFFSRSVIISFCIRKQQIALDLFEPV
jgi:hypothetical protein